MLKRSENYGGFQNDLNFYEYLEGGLSRVVPREFSNKRRELCSFKQKTLLGGDER